MAMTRKQFQGIADAVRAADETAVIEAEQYGAEVGWNVFRQTLCANLANYLATQNPNFDRHRFLVACGVED